MQQYLKALGHVLKHGEKKLDRTGVGTLDTFGDYQMVFDLGKGFPLVTTKKMHLKSIIYELLWFLKGDTNIKYLNDHGVRIWNEWADENGDLGPVYGKQWRRWEGPCTIRPTHPVAREPQEFRVNAEFDQIAQLIENLRTNPYSRRHVVSAWNVAELAHMKLEPCHCLFQFNVTTEGTLDCKLYQRSADLFLGVPFNIASYALLTMMVAQVVGLKPGRFIHTFGSMHLYLNHMDQVQTQLRRAPKALPRMEIKDRGQGIFGFEFEDFTLAGYESYPAVQAPIAV